MTAKLMCMVSLFGKGIDIVVSLEIVYGVLSRLLRESLAVLA